MTEQIKTEHMGYEIRYADNMDEWTVSDFSYSNVSLKKVKDHISRKQAALRKAGKFDCLMERNGVLSDVAVVEYIAPIMQRRMYTQDVDKTKEPADHYVWAMTPKHHSTKKVTRRQKRLSEFILDTPENRSIGADIEGVEANIAALKKRITFLRGTLKPVELEHLEKLIAASDQRVEEGDA
tara:strand:+ start:14181 stop:14723 length:543 start_codon:yes stop_codon:yes gene_type:complete